MTSGVWSATKKYGVTCQLAAGDMAQFEGLPFLEPASLAVTCKSYTLKI